MIYTIIDLYTEYMASMLQRADEIIGEVVTDPEARDAMKAKYYTDDINWDALVNAEEQSYTFDSSILPDNFFQ